MNGKKIAQFMELAGQSLGIDPTKASPEVRKLGAQLLLSETLEYVIKGLGVIPEVDGTPIRDANGLTYRPEKAPDKLEMLDGLSDVAYTMYWNAVAFGMRLDEAFEAVCDNNLEKFVRLNEQFTEPRPLEREEWDCLAGVKWPPEVVSVEVVRVGDRHFAVGKDEYGKVRKPSSYAPVDLKPLL